MRNRHTHTEQQLRGERSWKQMKELNDEVANIRSKENTHLYKLTFFVFSVV